MADSKQKAYSKDSRQRAREEFLQALERRAPEVRHSLAQDVFPLYERIGDLLARAMLVDLALWPEHLSEMARLRYASEKDLEHLPVALHSRFKFELTLCAWAQRWNLLDAWLFREALETLRDWHRAGITGDWAYVPYRRMANMASAFHFEYPPFDSAVDTWTSYRRRVEAAFANAFANYRERAKKQNIAKPKAREHSSYHFDWLIEFQVNKLGFSEIGKQYGRSLGIKTRNLDAITVREAIHSVAALIGLTLRNVKRGRKAHPSSAS